MRERRDVTGTFAVLCSICIVILMLARRMGDYGIGVTALPAIVLILLTGALDALPEYVCAQAVRSSIAKQQTNAIMRIRSGVQMISLMVFVISTVLILGFCYLTGPESPVLHTAVLPLLFVIPCSLILALQCGDRGFLVGSGNARSVRILRFVQAILLPVVVWLGSMLLSGLGSRVDGLLRTTHHVYEYELCGALMGIFVLLFAGFVYSKVTCVLVIKRQFRDLKGQKYVSTYKDQMKRLYLMGGTVFVLPVLWILIAYHICLSGPGRELSANAFLTAYGILQGEAVPYAILLGILFFLPFQKRSGAVARQIQHRNKTGAQDTYASLCHGLMLLLCPATIFTAALSKPLMNLVFQLPENLAYDAMLLASPLIFLTGITLSGSMLLLRIGNVILLTVNALLATVVFLVTDLVLSYGAPRAGKAVIVAFMAGLFVQSLLTFLELSRMLSYRQDWIRAFGMPLGCAAICGIFLYLLSGALILNIGDLLTFLLCLVLGCVVYFVLLLMVKDVSEYELIRLPFGEYLVRFAHMLHLL